MTEEDIQALRAKTSAIADEERATSNEEDLHVQVRTPIFAAGQLKTAEVANVSTSPDAKDDSGQGLVILVRYEIQESLLDIEGREYAPGQQVTDRMTVHSCHKEKAEAIQNIGRQQLLAFAMNTGAMEQASSGDWTKALEALPDTVGKQVLVRFNVREVENKTTGLKSQFQSLTTRAIPTEA